MWAEHILSQHNTNMSKCVDIVVLGPILCVIITSRIPQVIPNGNEMYKLLQSLVHSRKLTWIPKVMLLYGKETIAMMENFLKEKDPIVDSVDLKYNKNQVDHAHISYFDMVQPAPYAVKRNLINYKKKRKISSTTDRVVWFNEEGIGMQLSCWRYRVVWCNSPLQKVSRHLNFQGSSTLPKVLGGSVMTLESCRGVDGLGKVTPFRNGNSWYLC